MDGRKAYIDSSVVVRRLLQQPGAIRDWSAWEALVASELMQVEVYRTLDRLYVLGELSATELADHIAELQRLTTALQRIRIDPLVLQRASGPLPAPLGALDAIHLATALLWSESHSEELTFLTHDRQLALAARLCGLAVQTSRT
jgi:predicted nucleic acid-binding protein